MKKSRKTSLSITALILSFVLMLFLGGSFVVHKVITESLGADLTYFQTMRGVITQDAESESERQLKESSMRQDHRHISIYYEENFSELLPITKETLDLAIERTAELFGETDVVPFDLLVFENVVEMNGFSELETGYAFYSDFLKVLVIHNSGKGFILAEDELALYNFQQTLLHEYTHYAFTRRVSNLNHYPMWFVEGVAEYAGIDQERVFSPHFENIPFDQLTSTEQWEEALNTPMKSPYLQSYYAVDYLTAEYGEEVITQIIDSMEETRNFDESFGEVTGLTLRELESEFLSAYED